jgi:hypothetical protein
MGTLTYKTLKEGKLTHISSFNLLSASAANAVLCLQQPSPLCT